MPFQTGRFRCGSRHSNAGVPPGRLRDNALGIAPPLMTATIPEPKPQPRNPLHGVTLEAMLNALVAHYGWEGLGSRIDIRCFNADPSIASSLKFLRKTPWARAKVEGLYLFMLRDAARAGCKAGR